MLRPVRSFLASTDRQRLLVSSVPQPPTRSDRQRLTQPAAQLRPVRPKAAFGTFAIYGKDGTFISIDFGSGRLARTISLYDYLPAGHVPHLSNSVVDLVGYLPDTIGLDIGLGAGADVTIPFFSAGLSGLGGINLIWHTRGDAHADWPEVHLYYGYSNNFSKGSLNKRNSLLTATKFALAGGASGAAQLVLGWARYTDGKGRSGPAEDRWVGNGYNWTGKFYTVSFVQPVYGAWSIAGAYFQSVPFFEDIKKNTYAWRGISIGVGLSAKLVPKTGLGVKTGLRIKPDVANIFKNFGVHKFKSLGIGKSETNYSLLYGNGGDFIPEAEDISRSKRSIEGWNWEDFPGINQDHDK
jgi:hypothetical protein